jgi:hypothetical protein
MITKAEIGSITFNDNLSYGISGAPGLEMPPIRHTSYNLAGENFGKFVSAFYGKRRFALQGWVIGTTPSDFITKFDALRSALDILSGEQTIEFTLANGRLVQIDAVLLQLDAPYRPGVTVAVEFNAALEASFPYLVGQTENSQAITLASGGGGTVPPPTMPMSLSADVGGKIFVVNNGNAPSYPTARIAGPVTDPSLRNMTSQQDILFDLALLTGEYIDIDFKLKTITDNTGRNRYDSKVGDWWYLSPGTTEVRFTAGSTDAAALVDFKSRDGYLGL